MVKRRISKKQKRSSVGKPPTVEVSAKVFSRLAKLPKHVPGASFADKEAVAQALGDAILQGDAEAVKEILEGFVRANNVSKVAKEAGFSRIRVYQALEKTGNPTLDTICKIANAFVKAS